jgi:basic membrane protein A and related proteins
MTVLSLLRAPALLGGGFTEEEGMRRATKLVALLAVFGVVAAGCGGGSKAGAGVHVCYASDTGGVDDKSFNQKIHTGFEKAKNDLGIQYTFVESTSAADYQPNLLNFVNQDCDLIAPAGFNFGPATVESATANPDQKYAIFDYDIFDFSDPINPKDVTLPNVRELTYQTDQAAFLAGYLAAGMTKTGKVATYGGVLFPTVTIFMNGFSAGVRSYNQDNGTSVEVLGWNADTGEGTQISTDPAVGFDSAADGRRVAEDFISEGADIILPVAGPTGLGTVAAAQDAGNVTVIWVDDDGCVTAPESCSLFLTSVLKLMDNSAFETTQDVIDNKFSGGLFVGTLENGGVDIAPYHEFDSAVPQELKDKIEELKQGIIDGSVSVNPKDYPA